jgi:hypothetical protein
MLFEFDDPETASSFLANASYGVSDATSVLVLASDYRDSRAVVEGIGGEVVRAAGAAYASVGTGELTVTARPLSKGFPPLGARPDWVVLVDPDSFPDEVYEYVKANHGRGPRALMVVGTVGTR